MGLIVVSTPIYNPNWFVDGISHKNYNKLRTSKDIPQLNQTSRSTLDIPFDLSDLYYLNNMLPTFHH
jgi:cell division protein FtsI/penicillin-binding protein 2